MPAFQRRRSRSYSWWKVHQFGECLAETRHVAEVPARHHDPVRNFPAQRFEDAIHDRLLAFEAEGIDAVDEVDAESAADLLNAAEGVVEVAGNLHRQRPVLEGLR